MLVDVVGRITIIGDSLQADLQRVQLPKSRLAGRGAVSWPHGPLIFNLAIHADSATAGDIASLIPKFPAAAVFRGGLNLRSHGPKILDVVLDPLDIRYAGGTLVGKLTAVTSSDSGMVAVRDADVTATDFDLDFPRPVVPALPFYGRLSGHTKAEGPI